MPTPLHRSQHNGQRRNQGIAVSGSALARPTIRFSGSTIFVGIVCGICFVTGLGLLNSNSSRQVDYPRCTESRMVEC